ncbi:nuclear polyadenylated rna-binding nab2 [Pyrenophora seminiperda CCB06]|uniref:Nuclear polyadenylated rna-binding nab2 n=1 Tax=Pyrenophora seminiperda CCB06 TaxID=1302712 RepID=A0A3M7LW77_9PLEO|nr:nuclear polyadenylated rna-binding nab2 [Pyrenophora seminiperda CCB06]
MSDYEDEYDDYEADFFYVEEEYMAADDLAEHAVASPAPAACGDADAEEDWDRFDYFNDLEYASDGYDDATFRAHDVKGAKAGMKRKLSAKAVPAKKRIRKEHVSAQAEPTVVAHSPIVWRSQADRGAKPRMLQDNAQPYALFKDWREKLADTPDWPKPPPSSPPSPPGAQSSCRDRGKENMAFVTKPVSPPYDNDNEYENEEDEEDCVMNEEEAPINKDMLMAALQRQLATAGGPLSNMDHDQLLNYALRMMNDQDAGDDIAGEMADALLQGKEGEEEEEDGDADAEEELLSWLSQHRNGNGNKDAADDQPTAEHAEHEQPAKDTALPSKHPSSNPNIKRKADEQPEVEASSKVVKKRITTSFDAPTAASQARAARPAKTATRSKVAKRR